jgi:hypothetical protein
MIPRAHSRGDVWRRRPKLYSDDLFGDTIPIYSLRQVVVFLSAVCLFLLLDWVVHGVGVGVRI